MRFFSFLFLVFSFAVEAKAQPSTSKTYAETKREQDQKTYNDQYNNANKTNYNSRGSSKAGVDQNAINQLAEKFKRNAGKAAPVNNYDEYDDDDDNEKTASVDYARQELENRRIAQAALEERRRIAEKLAAAEKARWSGIISNFNALKAIGFDKTDAFHIADRLTAYPDGSYRGDQKDQDRYRAAINPMKYYTSIKDTASFALQIKVIYGFRAAGFTALKSLQALAARFPDKASVAEQAELETLAQVFWTDGTDYASDIRSRRDSQLQEAVDRYWILFEKYPKAAMNSLAYYHPDGSDPIRAKLQGSKSEKEFYYYADLLLLSAASGEHRRSYFEDMVLRNSDKKYWVNKPASFWQDWSQKLGVTPADLIARVIGADAGCLKAVCDGTLATSQTMLQENLLNDVLKKMADEGDASCLNAHALRTILYAESSGVRKKGYKYLYKAIEAGSMFARFNLLYCAQLSLPDAPDAEKTRQEIMSYLLNAPANEKYKAVLVITTARGPFAKDLGFLTLGYELCQQAAAAGNRNAQTSLAWKGWEQVKSIKE